MRNCRLSNRKERERETDVWHICVKQFAFCPEVYNNVTCRAVLLRGKPFFFEESGEGQHQSIYM